MFLSKKSKWQLKNADSSSYEFLMPQLGLDDIIVYYALRIKYIGIGINSEGMWILQWTLLESGVQCIKYLINRILSGVHVHFYEVP